MEFITNVIIGAMGGLCWRKNSTNLGTQYNNLVITRGRCRGYELKLKTIEVIRIRRRTFERKNVA